MRQQGWFLDVGKFDLRSFDGGKNWYAVNRKEDGSVIIEGPAEELFPGVIARIEAMDKLGEYVKKNGPINLSGKNASEGLNLLNKAGFTVEKSSK